MEFQRDIAPPPAPPPIEPEVEAPRQSRMGGMSFKEALAIVEGHRDKVQATLAIALIIRLVADFDFIEIARAHTIVAQLPFIGLAMLSYMIVLWFLAARTRDRWGFGMALGIGVLQATHAAVQVVALLMDKQFAIALLWKPVAVVVTHVALSYTSFHAGSAYPPLDSKKPWIFGFLTAFIFVAIPWVAVPLAAALGYQIG
jgi:hypothetical protein